jgi:nucleoid DNA-binding protein
MRNKQRWALAALLVVPVLCWGLAGTGYSQRGKANGKKDEGIEEQVAKKVRLQPAVVKQVIAALGPAVVAHITAGEQAVIPGLGTFRVVRIPEHRDLRNGRPTTIAATNYIEFIPAAAVVANVNGSGVTPSATVPQFEYVPRPNEVPSMRVPTRRAGRTRSP